MAALVVHVNAVAPTWWMWLVCLSAIALIPGGEWLVRSPRRRRIVLMLAVAVVLGGATAFALEPPPDIWANCCPAYILWGICWPIWWC